MFSIKAGERAFRYMLDLRSSTRGDIVGHGWVLRAHPFSSKLLRSRDIILFLLLFDIVVAGSGFHRRYVGGGKGGVGYEATAISTSPQDIALLIPVFRANTTPLQLLSSRFPGT